MDKSIDIIVGEKIRERRIELGMSQAELAFKLGYKSQQAISLIELGKRSLTPDQLLEMAKVLGTTHGYLLGDDDDDRDALTDEIKKLFQQLTPEQQTAVLRMIESIVTDKDR